MESLPTYFSGLLLVLLLTSFVKILTTLSIMRYGLGLNNAGFGAVIIAFSIAISFLIVEPQMNRYGGIEGLFSGKLTVSAAQVSQDFTPFLQKQTDLDIKERFVSLSTKLHQEKNKVEVKNSTEPPVGNISFSVLVSAFLVSELKEAFKLGFLFIIPFLVIDLVVANALLALGVSQLSNNVVSLPIKILLFFAVDGWTLITEKLISTYI